MCVIPVSKTLIPQENKKMLDFFSHVGNDFLSRSPQADLQRYLVGRGDGRLCPGDGDRGQGVPGQSRKLYKWIFQSNYFLPVPPLYEINLNMLRQETKCTQNNLHSKVETLIPCFFPSRKAGQNADTLIFYFYLHFCFRCATGNLPAARPQTWRDTKR